MLKAILATQIVPVTEFDMVDYIYKMIAIKSIIGAINVYIYFHFIKKIYFFLNKNIHDSILFHHGNLYFRKKKVNILRK